ncbi:MAG: O-antigen ligase family protein [Phormidesmis sp.]
MHFATDSKLGRAQSSAPTAGWKGQWLGAAGLFFLLGFTWLPNSYSLMVGWPYALIWQGAFGLLIGWGIWIARQFSQPLTGLGHRLDGIVLFVAFGNGLSVAAAQFKLVAGWNFCLLTSYSAVLYVVVSWLRPLPALRERLWFALAGCGVVTSVISLAAWRPTREMWSSSDFYAAIRNPFPLGHHNFVGGYCLLVMPLIVGFTLTQTRQRRWLGYGAIALNVAALYISGSRGALLGFVALALVSLPLYFIYHPAKTRRHSIVLGLLCLMVSGALLSNPRVRSLTSFSPSANSSAFSIQQIDDGPTKDRLFMLQAGRHIVTTHPLLGIGPGNLARVYNLYRPLAVGGGLELVQQLHNTPVQILVELGAIGFGGCLLGVGWLLKLGVALHKTIYNKTDRILLYSIGASWFGYAVFSLSDYQLENIGIASTLVITTALFISLANQYLAPTELQPLAQRTRRLISLCLLLYFSVVLQVWARADAGFYLASAAQKDMESFQLANANVKWTKASRLMPWDPTYAALSAEQLATIAQQTSEPKNKDLLNREAIASLKTALAAAPNDPWFNQNLAVLLLNQNSLNSKSSDPKSFKQNYQQAEAAIRRAALLFPRSQHYTYYTLGLTYLKQQKQSQATAALVLESLANPSFLADPLWNNPPFAELLANVVDRTLTAWQEVLKSTAADSAQHAWLQQQIILTQWWHHQLPSGQQSNGVNLNSKELAPIIQAILATEADPTKSLNLLAQVIQIGSADASKAALLQAWIAPDQYLTPFLKSFKGTPKEKQTIINDVRDHRNLRDWLTSVTEPPSEELRYGLAFAYRNALANNIRQVLFANGPTTSPLLDEFALFSPPPREFLQLDEAIAQIAAQDLALISPSQTHFEPSQP